MSAARSRTPLLVGAATNWLAFAAALAVSFVLTPHLIRTLGQARYDTWCVVESVLAYFTLLDLGIAACLVRHVARGHASADRDGLNRMASTCLAVFLAAGGVALVIGVPILFGLSATLNTTAGDADVLPFMLLMLTNLAATLPLSVFPNVLDGLERFAAKSAVRIIFLVLRTIGIVAVTAWQPGLLWLGVVYTVANIAEHTVLAGLCFRFLPGLRLSARLVDRATLRQVRGSSTDAFLAMLAGRITVQTGAIVVGLFLPPGSVTAFVVAARLVEYAKTLLRTVTTTLTPGVSAMEARGDQEGVRRLFLTATRWMLYLALPVNLGLWFFGRTFLVRWVGPEVGEGGSDAAMILATTLGVGVAQSVAARVLYGLGRLRLFARLALTEAVLNLMLTAALVGPLGVGGVATAVAVPNLLFCGVVIAFTARQLGVSPAGYAAAWLRPVAACAVAVFAWLIVGPPAATWLEIGTAVAAGLAPYAVAVAALELPGFAATCGRARDLCARTASPVLRKCLSRHAMRRV